VVQYARNAETGRLIALSPATVAAGINPHDLAISPDGESVYVANNASLGTVAQFMRNTATGALTAISTATIAAGEYTECLVVSPDGSNVYATNEVTGNISQYSRNTETGALTAQSVPTITTEANPEGIAMSADGEDLYVANHGSASVSQYGRASRPTVLTGSAGAVGESSATVSGSVNPNGQATTYHFDYGPTTAYGSQAPASPDPSAGSGVRAQPLSVGLAGLAVNTTYHFRLVSTSAAGVSYSADQTFTTLPAMTLPVPTLAQLGSGGGETAVQRAPLDEHEAPPVAGAKVVSSSLSVSPSGWVSVKLTCPAGRCTGTVTLHTLNAASPGLSGYQPKKGRAVVLTLASGSFTVAAGQVRVVMLHLSAKARTLLARTHVLRVRASIIVRSLAGATNTTQTIVTLRASNRSRRHGKG
jgi:Lactonase, 7-bladed beta-propeller